MDWNVHNKRPVNALLVVAHPDDETIFCGGTMLLHPAWNWTVICITMQKKTNRLMEFQRAMSFYRQQGVSIHSFINLQKEDTNKTLTSPVINNWRDALKRGRYQPDIVFTHNREGEYGHDHHKKINSIVHSLYQNVWDFVYPGDFLFPPQPTKKITNQVLLPRAILAMKRKIFTLCYPSQRRIVFSLFPLLYYEFFKGPEIFTTDE